MIFDGGQGIDAIDSLELKRRLQVSGCVVLRGMISNLTDLESVTQRWFSRFHQPATRFNSRDSDGDGFTSRVGTEGYLLGHSEGYYRPCLPPPDVCVFWCERAPVLTGGETTWLDGRAMFEHLPAALAQRLGDEQIVYEGLWAEERWQAEFDVGSGVALKRLLDSDPRCSYELMENSDLHWYFRTSAIQRRADGVCCFINGLLTHLPEILHHRYHGNAYSKPSNRIHWSNGGLLDTQTVNAMVDAHDAVLAKHRWQDGDVLVLDNHRALHGRVPMTSGDSRVIYSRFGFWF